MWRRYSDEVLSWEKTMARMLCGALAMMVLGICMVQAEIGAQDEDSKSVVLTCVRLDSQDSLEIRFGDVIARTKELSFVHSDGTKTNACVRNGVVELENGTGTITGKKVACSLRGGWLGSHGGRGGIKKSFVNTKDEEVKSK
jgi:hypothetical protein